MKNSLLVGCLGAGYFSQFHYQAWLSIPATRLIAAADTAPTKLDNSNAENAYSSLEQMLDSHRLDILDIITPPQTHYEAIVAACTYKPEIKPTLIICQKPFCTSVAEARQAVDVAEAAGVTLVIHENFRFQPWFRCMKNAIESKSLGQILQFTFRLRTGDGQGADAYLERQPYFQTMPRFLVHETGVHYLDTSIFLFGPVKSVYAELKTHNPAISGEDACLVLLEHENGVRSVIDGNRLLDHHSTNTRITFGEALLEGTAATVTLDGSGKVAKREFGTLDQQTLLEPKVWDGFAGDCVYEFQNHVVSALLNKTPVENKAEDYLAVLDLVDTVYDSANRGMRLTLS